MNRREFLGRLLGAGLVAASPKLIFDLAPQSFRQVSDDPFLELLMQRRLRCIAGGCTIVEEIKFEASPIWEMYEFEWKQKVYPVIMNP